MLDILRASPEHKVTYCVVTFTADGRVAGVECERASNVSRLVAAVKQNGQVCALEVHSDGRVYTECGQGQRIADILRKLK
ncbi:MAG: hypothetical protein C0167_03845 [Nitrososphaera sp.]|nr:MAG: hypothetical protein C0167_03845 [Nitrososphaera sp.]